MDNLCIVRAYRSAAVCTGETSLNELCGSLNVPHDIKFVKLNMRDNTRADIMQCCGYFKHICDKTYVITCEHLLQFDSTEYKAFRVHREKTETYSLKLYAKIYELDIAIFELQEKLSFDDLRDASPIESSYANNNVILTGQMSQEGEPVYKQIDINNELVLSCGSINSNALNELPCLNFSPYNMPDISKDMSYADVCAQLKSLSGSIVQHAGTPLSMILMAVINDEKLVYVKTIPLLFLNLIVTSYVTKSMVGLVGINVITTRCDFDYDNKSYVGRYVVKKTCPYTSGKKNFCFNTDDIIMKVDEIEFDTKSKLYMRELGISVTLNTFLFLRCMLRGNVAITLIKQHTKKQTPLTYCIEGINYNSIFKGKTAIGYSIKWKNMLFTELSEEFLCQPSNANLIKWRELTREYATANEKYIVMCYEQTVCNRVTYIVDKIGNKKITSIRDLLGSIAISRGKHPTFSLIDAENRQLKFLQAY